MGSDVIQVFTWFLYSEVEMQGVKIELVPGLPWREVDQVIANACEGEGVCKRVQSFFLHDLKVRREYQAMGFSSVAHYGMERHGMSRRRVNELLVVGEQLQDLKDVDAAYLAGELCWSQVKQLLRVVRVSNQDEWIARAKELKTVSRLKKAVDQARAGRVPRGGEGAGLPEPKFEQRFSLRKATNDKFESIREEMMQRLGRPVTTSEVVEALMQLHKPRKVDPEKEAARLAAAEDKETPKWLARRILARDRHRCVSCGAAGKYVHHIIFREHGGRTYARNLTTICLDCHGLVHSGLLQIRGEAPGALEFLDRFGKPRDASIAPVLAVLTRPRTEPPRGEHAPGLPYLYSIDEIPKILPRAWVHHPQIEFSTTRLGFDFIPLEQVLARKR